MLLSLATGLGTSTSLGHGSNDIPNLDQDQVERLAQNIENFLTEMQKVINDYLVKSMPTRLRILADVQGLFTSMPPRDRGCLLSRVVFETQKLLALHDSPKVAGGNVALQDQVGLGSVDFGDAGTAYGVKLTSGQTTVTVGVIADLHGIRGGGIGVEHRY